MDSDGGFCRFGKKPQSYGGRELRELVIFLHFLWLGVVDEMQLSHRCKPPKFIRGQ